MGQDGVCHGWGKDGGLGGIKKELGVEGAAGKEGRGGAGGVTEMRGERGSENEEVQEEPCRGKIDIFLGVASPSWRYPPQEEEKSLQCPLKGCLWTCIGSGKGGNLLGASVGEAKVARLPPGTGLYWH